MPSWDKMNDGGTESIENMGLVGTMINCRDFFSFPPMMRNAWSGRTIGKDAVSALVNVSAEDTSVAALEDMCKASIVSR